MFPTDRDLEGIEARAHADSAAACPPTLAAGLGLHAEPGPDRLLMTAARIPEILFNRAFGFGVGAPLDDAALDAVLARVPAGGRFQVVPGHGLSERLAARGWRRTTRWIKVVRAAAPDASAPTGLTVRRVSDAARWGDVVRTGFGMPPVMTPWLAALHDRPRWTLFEAADGDRPVAGAALFVDGPLGWLGMGSTIPEGRGRGAQSALIAARVAEAARQRATHVVCETGEDVPERPNPSARNLLRGGFMIRYHKENWAAP